MATIVMDVLQFLLVDIAAFYILATGVMLLVRYIGGGERAKRMARMAQWHHLYRIVFLLFPWLIVLILVTPHLQKIQGRAYQVFFCVCAAVWASGIALIVYGLVQWELPSWPINAGVSCMTFGYMVLSLSRSDYRKGGDDKDDDDPQEPDGPDTPNGDAVEQWLRGLTRNYLPA